MYKRIEKEREAWVKRLREAETLREYLAPQLPRRFQELTTAAYTPAAPGEAPPPPLATD
jgi:hypothetical protein